ncbi:hypothetical protein AXK57_07390 [Tsukamurella pulmonis]|uniref:hypothetical protein n=1 Tax=Tsukamurella pulmonis TaxID=47312 RepID=UPI0007979F96|nr:hypothetical protein [Tsukamurella pulmonis]KXP11172.1 hypothetical protein AXK57_07390 [Tsukamurella pulmonis]RDH11315.1 hypothetical protein DVB88_13505 [Tsukamurella pulmonis]
MRDNALIEVRVPRAGGGDMGMGNGSAAQRGAALVVAGAALVAAAACTPVAGSGSAQQSDVAAYQSTLASSRAASAAAAKTSVCASWQAGFAKRDAVTSTTVAATKNPAWTWDSIAPTIAAELAAVATESTALPALIATRDLPATVSTVLTDYKAKLDAYGAAMRADQAARAEDSWARTNPALDALERVGENVKGLCTTK